MWLAMALAVHLVRRTDGDLGAVLRAREVRKGSWAFNVTIERLGYCEELNRGRCGGALTEPLARPARRRAGGGESGGLSQRAREIGMPARRATAGTARSSRLPLQI